MIITASNIKLNFYSGEKADLYIRFAGGTSDELVRLVKDNKVFENVYVIQAPRIKCGRNLIKFNIKYKRQYDRIFTNIGACKTYTDVFVAGFWNDSLYYINEFFQYNNKIRIHLYDEGGITYELKKGDLCKYVVGVGKISWKVRIKQAFPLLLWQYKYKKNVEDKIYVYVPEWYKNVDSKLECIQIPAIQKNKEMLQIMCGINSSDAFLLSIYNRCKIIYIGRGASLAIPDADKQDESIILSMVAMGLGKKVVVKTHPNVTSNRCLFGKELEKKVNIDRGKYTAESIFNNIDIDNKILVMYGSSTAMFTKKMLDKEPYIVFVFRMFHQYDEQGDIVAEKYAKKIIGLYKNKNKIAIPNNMYEFERILQEQYYKTLNY